MRPVREKPAGVAKTPSPNRIDEHLFDRVCSRAQRGGTLERPLDIRLRIDRTGSIRHFRQVIDHLSRTYGRKVVATESDGIVQAVKLGEKAQARRTRAQSVRRQIVELERELAACELEAIGYERAIEGLLGGIVDRIEAEHGPDWSPWPVFGYRLWQIKGGGLYGAWDRWAEPVLTAECKSPRSLVIGPTPHDSEVCGPPSCGIYAVKDLAVLLGEFPGLDHSRLAIGLVALSGRVVEHRLAYRAQHARVVAITATIGRRLLLTADRQRILELFADPDAAALTFPEVTEHPNAFDDRIVDFLADQERRHTGWT
jgi:hypothetical protein